MSEEPGFTMEASEISTELMTQDQAWQMISYVVNMTTQHGFIEHQIEHTPWAERLKKAHLELLAGFVNNTTVCQGMSEEGSEKISRAMADISNCYGEFYEDVLQKLAIAIQSLPLNLLITDTIMQKGDIDEAALEGLSERAKQTILAQKAAHNARASTEDVRSTLIAKPCEPIQILFAVASVLLGGPEKMARVQAEVVSIMPESHRRNPTAVMASQLCAALSQGLQQRMQREDFATATVAGLSEAYLAMRRVAIMPLLPMWDDKPGDIYGKLLDIADESVEQALAGYPERQAEEREPQSADEFMDHMDSLAAKPAEKPLEADKPDNMKATSTLFTGTRTIN